LFSNIYCTAFVKKASRFKSIQCTSVELIFSFGFAQLLHMTQKTVKLAKLLSELRRIQMTISRYFNMPSETVSQSKKFKSMIKWLRYDIEH